MSFTRCGRSPKGGHRRRATRALIGAAVVSALLSACAGQDGPSDDELAAAVEGDDGGEAGTDDAPGGAQEGGTLRVAVGDDFDTIDPHTASSETSATWLALIYEPLIGSDSNADPVPGVAESWDISDDGLTYTFTLRDDVHWHNGRQLVAEDVKFNIERIQDPNTGAVSAGNLAVISEVEVPDERTVVLHLEEPSGPLLNDLAQQGRAALVAPESFDDENRLVDHIGTGPYRFGDYTISDQLTMTANPEYWDGGPNIETVEVRIVPDGTARLSAVQSGEIDLAWAVPPEQGFASEGDGYSMVEVPQNRGNYVSVNVQRHTDERLRRAMHLAISREDVAQAAWDGHATPTAQPFSESSFWYVEDLDAPMTADLETARELVADAGAEGTDINIVSWDQQGSETEAQVVAAAWEEIGLDVSVEVVDIATLLDRASSGDYDVTHLWVGLITDPNRPYGFNHSEHPRHGITGSANDPELDELVDAGRRETDPEQRREIYQQVLERNYELAAQYYLVNPKTFSAVSDRVQDYEQGVYYVFHADGGVHRARLAD